MTARTALLGIQLDCMNNFSLASCWLALHQHCQVVCAQAAGPGNKSSHTFSHATMQSSCVCVRVCVRAQPISSARTCAGESHLQQSILPRRRLKQKVAGHDTSQWTKTCKPSCHKGSSPILAGLLVAQSNTGKQACTASTPSCMRQYSPAVYSSAVHQHDGLQVCKHWQAD